MESKTEIDFLRAKPTSDAVIYRAVGWVAGRYQPGEEDIHRGIFVTEDGLSIPAQMTGQLRGRLKRKNPDYATQPDFFNQSFQWTVYPKTEPLRFALTGMKLLSSDHTEGSELDEFCVVGKVKLIESERIDVLIQRNQPPRWGGKKASFKLTLAGSLPEIALGQIWELTVRREGEKLAVVDGQIYQPSAEDLVWLEQQRQAKVHSNLPAPILKQQLPSPRQVDTTIAAPQSPAVPPKSEAKESSDVPQACKSADALTTKGKMEVVVKLNQFPDEVKTVDKDWKEFEVDTGDWIVTITVKPKAFAVLEQAQQTYPSWVAAISGFMGEATATGFKLESPAIKVFERKAKDTQTESTKILNDLEPSPATSSEPPSPVQTQTQQQQALPKPESPPQKSPIPNPLARVKEPLKQQRPSKTPSHQPQHQRDQPAFGKKQFSPATTSVEPQQQKPVFQVKVNDRVFNGYDSVTLNRRVICVDGKPVAQSKMALVVGHPATMQADGGVTQGSNQAVLISK